MNLCKKSWIPWICEDIENHMLCWPCFNIGDFAMGNCKNVILRIQNFSRCPQTKASVDSYSARQCQPHNQNRNSHNAAILVSVHGSSKVATSIKVKQMAIYHLFLQQIFNFSVCQYFQFKGIRTAHAVSYKNFNFLNENDSVCNLSCERLIGSSPYLFHPYSITSDFFQLLKAKKLYFTRSMSHNCI